MRPVVSVVLAVVLVGIGTGALASTATERAAIQLEGDVDRLERVAVDLAATSTATDRIDRAGRAPVTVRIPDGTVATARVEQFQVGCPVSVSDDECPPWQASYRLQNGEVRTVSVDGDAPRLRTVDEPLVLGPGAHRLTLAYVRFDGDGVGAGYGDRSDDGHDETAVIVERNRP